MPPLVTLISATDVGWCIFWSEGKLPIVSVLRKGEACDG